MTYYDGDTGVPLGDGALERRYHDFGEQHPGISYEQWLESEIQNGYIADAQPDLPAEAP